MSDNNMNQQTSSPPEDELRDEYDFSGGVRGKFYKQYLEGTKCGFAGCGRCCRFSRL